MSGRTALSPFWWAGKDRELHRHPDEEVVKRRAVCWEPGGKGQGRGDGSSTRT